MRSYTDKEINCAARRILVRHWIDLGCVCIRTTRGVVYVSGTLTKLRDAGRNLSAGEISTITMDIQRLDGVRRLQLGVTNCGSTFAEASPESAPLALAATVDGVPSPATHDLSSP